MSDTIFLPMEERFWSKVEKGDGCWKFNGANRTIEGYKGYRMNGKTKLAHRVAYELHHKNTIPEGLVVRHKCDNPACCNPDHLELGTHQDNTNDKVLRNRQAKHKLTEDIVREIKQKLKLGQSSNSIAKQYGVTHSTIDNIKTEKTWKHLVVE